MKTIAWDVDDVLNDLMRAWFTEAFLVEHPETTLTYDAITANPPHDVLGIPLDAYLASLDAFREKRQSSLAPSPEILAWLAKHGDGFRHLALTATPLKNAHRSAEWTIRHFGRWIRTVTFLPSPRAGEDPPIYDASKAAHLTWIGHVDVLVDDTPKNLVGLSGVKGVLVPRPWNGRSGSIADALAEL